MKNILKDAITDWIFWISLLITGIWFALKMAGIIKTPLWLELMPVATIIFSAGAFFQTVRAMRVELVKIDNKIGHMDKDIAYLRIDTEVLKNDMGTVKRKIGI